jgi:hypothetical protein
MTTRGRPTLPPESLRSKPLQLRLTPAQFVALERLREAERLVRGRDVALSDVALALLLEHPRFVLASADAPQR